MRTACVIGVTQLLTIQTCVLEAGIAYCEGPVPARQRADSFGRGTGEGPEESRRAMGTDLFFA